MTGTLVDARSLRSLAFVFAVLASVVAPGAGHALDTGEPAPSNATTLGPNGSVEPDPSPETFDVRLGQRGPGPEATTVITTSERVVNGSRANFLVAVAPDGRIRYYNDSLRVYNDVDPVPGTRATVVYVGADRLNTTECHATTACWENVVERVNLTTGEVRRIYSRTTSIRHGQWHDVDRINDTHLLVGDIALDRVFVVDVTSGIHEWTWSAHEDFPLHTGGPFPRDWTHLNDVELLDDGRVMVSLRNHDRVVFVNPRTGLLENWTLGAEDDYDVLYEQHNPDYIPRERGGPAVLVADSENDRIEEYHRVCESRERPGGTRTDECPRSDAEWRLAWSWSDARLDWPRDADRLPNGHTLITDTDGGRVLEVDERGSVVWSVGVEGAYDAERLGTGDESAGGPAATDPGASDPDPASRTTRAESTAAATTVGGIDRNGGRVADADAETVAVPGSSALGAPVPSSSLDPRVSGGNSRLRPSSRTSEYPERPPTAGN